jgi:hypothetical protein
MNNQTKPKAHIFVVTEGLAQSIITDVVTLAVWLTAFWFTKDSTLWSIVSLLVLAVVGLRVVKQWVLGAKGKFSNWTDLGVYAFEKSVEAGESDYVEVEGA